MRSDLAYDPKLFDHHLSVMILKRYLKKHIPEENWLGADAGLQ
jgi:hypothetical protein